MTLLQSMKLSITIVHAAAGSVGGPATPTSVASSPRDMKKLTKDALEAVKQLMVKKLGPLPPCTDGNPASQAKEYAAAVLASPVFFSHLSSTALKEEAVAPYGASFSNSCKEQ